MFKLFKTFGLLALTVLSATAAQAAAGAQPIRKIIVFNPGVAVGDRVKIAASTGGHFVRRLDLINAVVVEASEDAMRSAESRLRAHAAVKRIDSDPKINWLLGASAVSTFQNTPLPDLRGAVPKFQSSRAHAKDAPTGQELPWGIARVNAPAAWSATRGQNVKVVVIDTGIDYDHPELKANIKGGWNAIKVVGDPDPGYKNEKPNDFKDDNGHGTHVSGTIAAIDDNAGVVGVAPQVSLYGVKVLDANGSGTFDDVIAGMLWAVENKMQVASMSLGADVGNDSLKAAVEAMAKAGVVLIAAAGNSGSAVGYPAAYPGAIAIAAMDSSNKVAEFSSRGPEVALIAPGVDVKSTYMGGAFDTMSGTSMATPHVSGLAALAIAAKGLSGYEQVKAALAAAATPLPEIAATEQGAGAVDAAKLVK